VDRSICGPQINMRLSAFLRQVAPAVAFMLPLAVSQPAAAQGFFQQLFGFATPAAQAPASQPNLSNGSGTQMTPGGRPYTLPSSAYRSTRPSADTEDDGKASKSGTYKTICVRMCDGYFFPISTATNRNSFYRDGQKCRATCGEDARLFHMPAGGLDVGVATDQNGRVYSLLPSAFKYRKTLVAGCQCKPDPWSDAEAARHQKYADADDAERAKLTAVASLTNKPAPVAAATTPAGDATATQTAVATKVTAQNGPDLAPSTVTRVNPPSKLAANKLAATKAAPRGPTRQPTLVAIDPKPSNGFAGGMGLGGSKLMWPGDAPSVRR
jgi:Protein of unknown function (DUF2865)